jgi:hypothetical protein
MRQLTDTENKARQKAWLSLDLPLSEGSIFEAGFIAGLEYQEYQQEQTYSPREAATLIINGNTGQPGISLSRINSLCREGRLGRRVGYAWVISQEEIDEFNKAPKPTQWEGRRKQKTPIR